VGIVDTLAGEIEAIVGYCAEVEECYFLPQEMSVELAAVQLRLAPTLNEPDARHQVGSRFRARSYTA